MTSVQPLERPVILCGKGDVEFREYPQLQGRHCILPAGHESVHIAQRDDETIAETAARCARPRP
jgi:hypothetical protein